MTRTLVAPLGRLVADGRVRLEAEGCAVLVALVEGAPYAVDDACRHRGTALSGGLLRDGVVTCPGHLWQYDVRTGERHDTDAEGLATYPVEVVGDEVRVQVPDPVRTPSLREALLAHARDAAHARAQDASHARAQDASHARAQDPDGAAPADPSSRMRVPQRARDAIQAPLIPRQPGSGAGDPS